jgi:hypothetical protein
VSGNAATGRVTTHYTDQPDPTAPPFRARVKEKKKHQIGTIGTIDWDHRNRKRAKQETGERKKKDKPVRVAVRVQCVAGQCSVVQCSAVQGSDASVPVRH